MLHVKRVMCAFALVLIAGLSFAGAQDSGNTRLENDKGKMVVRGVMQDVPLSEMVLLYSQTSGRPVMYDARKMRANVTMVAPKEGLKMSPETALRTTLSEYRMALVDMGAFDQIVLASEMCCYAHAVDVSELEKMHDLAPVRIVVRLINSDANSIRGAVMNLVSRQAGVVSPVSRRGGGQSVIICDYAENVRRILKVIEQMDSLPATISRVVVPKNRKIEDIQPAVYSAAGKLVDLGFDKGANAIVLSGEEHDVQRVNDVINALDVKVAEEK